MNKGKGFIATLKGWFALSGTAVKVSAEAAKAMDHTLNGIALYYRDTDVHGLTSRGLATVGQVVKTDMPLLASRTAGRCLQRVRFVIASSRLNNEQTDTYGLTEAPRLRAWDAAVLHPKALLKVMDVYTYRQTTQVVLLHIDHRQADLFRPGGELYDVERINAYTRHTAGFDLKEITRQGLHDKYLAGPRPKEDDGEWRRLTAPLFCPELNAE